MPIAIRRATHADAATIAHHRAAMFHDMHPLSPEQFAELARESALWLDQALRSGEYVGWLAESEDATVIAGAGLQRRRAMPHPDVAPDGSAAIALGHHALVINVYTVPEWRSRGVARQLMETLLAWTDAEGVERVMLHASDAGRPLYETMGFIATNEMRRNPRLPARFTFRSS